MVSRGIWALACGVAVLLSGTDQQWGNERGLQLDQRAQEEAAVEIKTFQYRPSVLEVTVGSRVTWSNHDDILHTVTSGMPGERDGRFDSSLEQPGSVYSFSFTEPGTYSYYCARHEFMRGQVIVKETAEYALKRKTAVY